MGPGHRLRAFRDVAGRGHWARPYVDRLAANGVFDGYLDGDRFEPDRPATLLDRALAPVQVTVKVEAEFRDGAKVPPRARDAMARMRARGLLSGYADGTLRPDRLVTRSELAAMLTRFRECRDAVGAGAAAVSGDAAP